MKNEKVKELKGANMDIDLTSEGVDWNQTSCPWNEEENKKTKNEENQSIGLCLGMCFGLSIGMSIGSLFDKMTIGMVLGEGIGMLLGALYDNFNHKKQGKEEKKNDRN